MNNVHHRIWVGSFLPRSYQLNLLRFKVHNPRYVIHLWTDFATITPEEKQQFEDFCEKHNFILHSIREHRELLNIDLIDEELEKSQTAIEKKRVHFVRASDLARVSIEYEMGGLYLDTDTNSLAPLPEFSSRYGFFLKRLSFFDRLELALNYDRPTKFGMIYNDFIAAKAKHPFFKFVAEIARLDYQTYHNSEHRLWESSIIADIHLYATVRLTGSSIRFALNYQVAHGELVATLANENDLFFNDEECLDSTYDKSWLADLSSVSGTNIPREEKASMEAFREEIDSERSKAYPHDLPAPPLPKPFQEHDYFFRDQPKLLMPELHYSPLDLLDLLKDRQQHHDIEAIQSTFNRDVINFSLAPPEIKFSLKPIELKLPQINFLFISQAIELLTAYLQTIPRQGFAKLFARPPVFQAVSELIQQIKKNQLLIAHQILERLQDILDRLPELQKPPLSEIITTLKEGVEKFSLSTSHS